MSIHYAFEELDRKFPDDSLAFARIGEALIREERTAEAIRMLTSGTSRYPRYITGLLVLARAYKAADRTAEAKSELEKVLRLDANCPAALNMLAGIAEASGDPAERLRHLEVLLRQEPWDEGFRAVQQRIFKPVEKPKSPSVVARVDHLTKVDPVIAKIREEEAEEEFEDEGSDPFPNVATVTLAEIYLQQGLKEQALQIYRQLVERQPDNEAAQKRLRELEASTNGEKT